MEDTETPSCSRAWDFLDRTSNGGPSPHRDRAIPMWPVFRPHETQKAMAAKDPKHRHLDPANQPPEGPFDDPAKEWYDAGYWGGSVR